MAFPAYSQSFPRRTINNPKASESMFQRTHTLF